MNDGQVASNDPVSAKVRNEFLFSVPRPREHHDATRVSIKAMHSENPARAAWPFAIGGEPFLKTLVQSRLDLLSPRGPSSFFRVPKGRDAGGFVHDDDVRIGKEDFDLSRLDWRGEWILPYSQRLSLCQFACLVNAKIAVDLNVSLLNETPDLGPTELRRKSFHGFRDRKSDQSVAYGIGPKSLPGHRGLQNESLGISS